MRLTKAASWQQEVPSPEFWKKFIPQLEHLGRKHEGLILSFLLCLKVRNKNKCHITDTINHLLSLNYSVVPVSFVNNWVPLLLGPTLHPCPGWCLKWRLIPSPSELCCSQRELKTSLSCDISACWYTWAQMCLLARVQYLPGQQLSLSWTLVANECHNLEVRKISSLTNKFVRVCFFFLLKSHFLQQQEEKPVGSQEIFYMLMPSVLNMNCCFVFFFN